MKTIGMIINNLILDKNINIDVLYDFLIENQILNDFLNTEIYLEEDIIQVKKYAVKKTIDKVVSHRCDRCNEVDPSTNIRLDPYIFEPVFICDNCYESIKEEDDDIITWQHSLLNYYKNI